MSQMPGIWPQPRETPPLSKMYEMQHIYHFCKKPQPQGIVQIVKALIPLTSEDVGATHKPDQSSTPDVPNKLDQHLSKKQQSEPQQGQPPPNRKI